MVVVVVCGGRGGGRGGGRVAGACAVCRGSVDGDGGAVVEEGGVFQVDFFTEAHVTEFEVAVPI